MKIDKLFFEKIFSKNRLIKNLIILFTFLYFVTFFIFESIPKLNFIVYPFLVALGILEIVYIGFNRKKFNFTVNEELICIFLFAVFVLLSTAIGNKHFSYTKTPLLLVASFFVVYMSFSIISNLKIASLIVLLASITFFVSFLIKYIPNFATLNFNRLGSFFGNENDVGIKLFVAYGFLFISAIVDKKYWTLLLAPVILFCIFTTGSKKAVLLCVAITLLSAILFFKHSKIISLSIIVTFVALLLIVFFTPAFANVKKRLFDFFSFFVGNSSDGSTENRFLFFQNSIYLGANNFMFGLGANGFKEIADYGKYSHNNFGEVLTNFGIFGIISFYFPFYVITKNFNNQKLIVKCFLLLFLVTFIFCSFSLVFFDSKLYFALLAFSLSIMQKKRTLFTEINI